MAFSSSSLPETSPGGQEWSHMNKQLQQMTYGDAGLAFLPGVCLIMAPLSFSQQLWVDFSLTMTFSLSSLRYFD